MKVLELFAGTRSIGKAFEARGHEVFSVEWNKDFENIDLYEDISKVTAQDILEKFGRPDVIWASPDCTSYSVSAISHHRTKNSETGNLDPKTDYAKFCDDCNKHVVNLIKELNPKYFFIENPVGGAAQDELDAEFTKIYGNILSVWRAQTKTYRYLDKSSYAYVQANV